MPRTFRGTVVAPGEAVQKKGNRLIRVWRPTLRTERDVTEPDGRADQNVSLHCGTWFLGEPITNHDIEVTGEWKEQGTGGYLEVAVYKDYATGATYSKDARVGSTEDAEGDVTEWRELTITGQDTAFTFTLNEGPNESRSIAFRGDAKDGARGLVEGAHVHVAGKQESGGVMIPTLITFPDDPLMPPWSAKLHHRKVGGFLVTLIALVGFSILPWFIFNLDFGVPSSFEDQLRREILPIMILWSCLLGGAALYTTAVFLRSRFTNGRHRA